MQSQSSESDDPQRQIVDTAIIQTTVATNEEGDPQNGDTLHDDAPESADILESDGVSNPMIETPAEDRHLETAEVPLETPKADQLHQAADFLESEESTPPHHLAVAAVGQPNNRRSPKGLAGLFPIVAWVILGAGVIGTILSWTSIGRVEAGVRLTVPESLSALPLGLLLGFAYLAMGILGFAFFWVSSLISRQLKDIQHLLAYPVSLSQKENEVEDQ